MSIEGREAEKGRRNLMEESNKAIEDAQRPHYKEPPMARKSVPVHPDHGGTEIRDGSTPPQSPSDVYKPEPTTDVDDDADEKAAANNPFLYEGADSPFLHGGPSDAGFLHSEEVNRQQRIRQTELEAEQKRLHAYALRLREREKALTAIEDKLTSNGKDKSHREAILSRATSLTMGEKNEAYGDPVVNHANISTLWNNYINIRMNTEGFAGLDAEDVALMLALLKVVRIAQRGSNEQDSFVDLCAYAAIAAECREKLND